MQECFWGDCIPHRGGSGKSWTKYLIGSGWLRPSIYDCLINNPLTPIGDQDIISPYNIITIWSRNVMRIKKKISKEIAGWSETKFSEVKSWVLYSRK